jgi:hypothetical protein
MIKAKRVPLKPFTFPQGPMVIGKNGNQPVLYRHFGENARLLYVGISNAGANSRWRAHNYTSAWFDEVAFTTYERGFETLKSLLAAEDMAIKREHPKYNKNKT